MGKKLKAAVAIERIDRSILLIRTHKVMLDADLAALYGVETARTRPGGKAQS